MTHHDPWGETLHRRLGLWSAVAVLIGSTIGSGIFRTPASVAAGLGDVPLVLAAWAVGGVIALCGAITYAELSAMFPRSGGMYVFLREAFGPLPAFLFGWAELLVIRPGAYGAISITASAYGLRAMGLDPASPLGPLHLDQALGAGLIAVVAVVNALGIERGAWLQNASTLLKVGALVALVALGLRLGVGLGLGALEQRASPGMSAFLLALVSILWAYDGWADLAFVGGEVESPQRVLPRALLLGTSVVVALYLAANVVYLHLVPLERMATADLVAADAASATLGAAGGVAVAVAVSISTFGTLNGSMMTSPRIFFAMAEDGLFPSAIARVDARTGAPVGAIALCAGLGIVFVCIRTFTELAEQFVIGIWPFYALCVVAVFVLRRTRPELPRPYRTVGYPWVPGLFLLASLLLLGNYVVSQPGSVAVDLALILSGIPVYLGWKAYQKGSTTRR
jgi:APA family basic amino acid/polyamine antiporter